MNITTFLEPEPKLLSTSENWRKTNFYELCSESQFYGNAHVATLSKADEPKATTALISLLQ